MENYEWMDQDGVRIYVRRRLAALFTVITITVEKLLFIRFLVANGRQ